MSSPVADAAAVSIVVPLLNEEQRLTSFILEVGPKIGTLLCPHFLLQEIVLVDDGSSDTTAARLAELARDTRWNCVQAAPGRHGKGDAIARGIASAQGTHVLVTDVDLAAPLREFGKLARALEEGADVAIGSRDIEGSVVSAPQSRIWIGRTFNRLVRIGTGLKQRDTQCGFKLMRTDIARTLTASLTVVGLAFDVELLLRARRAQLTVVEVPINYAHGALSRVRLGADSLLMVRDVVKLAITYRLRSPTGHTHEDAVPR